MQGIDVRQWTGFSGCEGLLPEFIGSERPWERSVGFRQPAPTYKTQQSALTGKEAYPKPHESTRSNRAAHVSKRYSTTAPIRPRVGKSLGIGSTFQFPKGGLVISKLFALRTSRSDQKMIKPLTPIICILLISGCGITLWMPGRNYSGPFLPLTQQEEEIRGRVVTHVEMLAGDIGPRNLWQADGLEAAAQYITEVLQNMDYEVRLLGYDAEECLYGDCRTGRVNNIEVELKGERNPDEIVVVGAHYDSVSGFSQMFSTPGADDNASGVAALLELARLLRSESSGRTIRLVFFVNEEPPFFKTEQMGSRVYARDLAELGANVVAMISLDMLGVYSEERGSQDVPGLLSWVYPNTANFVSFVGDGASAALVQDSIRAFRAHIQFPSEGIAAPADQFTGIDWSDHWSFAKEGYPAIMITDTSFYRYPDYHEPGDVPANLDFDRLARVTHGLSMMLLDLARFSR